MKKIATLLLFGVLTLSATAQKIGHVSMDSVLKVMPEVDTVKKTYSTYGKQLEKQYQEYLQEYKKQSSDKTVYTGALKASKDKDLQDLGQRIQSFQQNAQKDLQHLSDSLQKPITEKVMKAINDVSNENGYSYILNTDNTTNVLFYKSSNDIYGLVIKKLGINKK